MNLFQFTPEQQNRGLLVLRIGLGIMMIGHGYPKLMGGPDKWAAVGSSMQYIGLGFGYTFFGLAAAVTEVFGGLLLALGLFTRLACFLLFCTMAVATFRHIGTGDSFGGWSHAAELAIVFLALIWIGPGRYSLDYNWFGRKNSNHPFSA